MKRGPRPDACRRAPGRSPARTRCGCGTAPEIRARVALAARSPSPGSRRRARDARRRRPMPAPRGRPRDTTCSRLPRRVPRRGASRPARSPPSRSARRTGRGGTRRRRRRREAGSARDLHGTLRSARARSSNISSRSRRTRTGSRSAGNGVHHGRGHLLGRTQTGAIREESDVARVRSGTGRCGFHDPERPRTDGGDREMLYAVSELPPRRRVPNHASVPSAVKPMLAAPGSGSTTNTSVVLFVSFSTRSEAAESKTVT